MAKCPYYIPGPWNESMAYDAETAKIRDKFGWESPEYKARLVTPDGRMAGPRTDYDAEDAFVKTLFEESDKATITNPVGYVACFPVGDGSAMYRVEKTNPLTLGWIPAGDRWDIPEPHMRGLRVADIKDQIRFRDTWNKLSKKEAANG